MVKTVDDHWKTQPRVPGDGPGGAPGGQWMSTGGSFGTSLGSSALKGTMSALGLGSLGKKAKRIHRRGMSTFSGRGRPSAATKALYAQARQEAGHITPPFGMTAGDVAKEIFKNAAYNAAGTAAKAAVKGVTKEGFKALGTNGYIDPVSKSRTSYSGNLMSMNYNPFDAPVKIPATRSTFDERGFRINIYAGKVTKKRRPTFPNGYNKGD